MKEETGKHMTVIPEKIMSVEEYIQYELTSDLRHEYINGQLLEIPGEKLINNKISFFLAAFFLALSEKGYSIYGHGIKVSIPGENKFYYPDLVITLEPSSGNHEYVVDKPELLIEIISQTSRIRDTVDKYLDYIKIPSLKYYLVINPETPYVTVHAKNEKGQWEADAYISKQDIIPLPLLAVELPLSVIYK